MEPKTKITYAEVATKPYYICKIRNEDLTGTEPYEKDSNPPPRTTSPRMRHFGQPKSRLTGGSHVWWDMLFSPAAFPSRRSSVPPCGHFQQLGASASCLNNRDRLITSRSIRLEPSAAAVAILALECTKRGQRGATLAMPLPRLHLRAKVYWWEGGACGGRDSSLLPRSGSKGWYRPKWRRTCSNEGLYGAGPG